MVSQKILFSLKYYNNIFHYRTIIFFIVVFSTSSFNVRLLAVLRDTGTVLHAVTDSHATPHAGPLSVCLYSLLAAICVYFHITSVRSFVRLSHDIQIQIFLAFYMNTK